jgi:hypothetical protein
LAPSFQWHQISITHYLVITWNIIWMPRRPVS